MFFHMPICRLSSLMMDLLRSMSHFYTGLFVFNLSFKKASYVLNNGSLSDVSFANIFSQAVACFLIIFDIVFHTAEIFNFN